MNVSALIGAVGSVPPCYDTRNYIPAYLGLCSFWNSFWRVSLRTIAFSSTEYRRPQSYEGSVVLTGHEVPLIALGQGTGCPVVHWHLHRKGRYLLRVFAHLGSSSASYSTPGAAQVASPCPWLFHYAPLWVSQSSFCNMVVLELSWLSPGLSLIPPVGLVILRASHHSRHSAMSQHSI